MPVDVQGRARPAHFDFLQPQPLGQEPERHDVHEPERFRGQRAELIGQLRPEPFQGVVVRSGGEPFVVGEPLMAVGDVVLGKVGGELQRQRRLDRLPDRLAA